MKKYFLTGLIILLPVAITIAVAGYLINFFTHPFVELVSASLKQIHIAKDGFLFLSHEEVIVYLSKILILACLFVVILLLGMLTRWYFVRALLHFWDKLLHKIPVINTVYKTTQELTKTLFTTEATAFKQVVMVPFPHKDAYVLGLIAGDAPSVCDKSRLVSVLIPTAPLPTNGFLLLYKTEDLIVIDMKPEDAIKYIVSCGVLAPEERLLS
ncbi:MAG: DUF502 domain-containing protein [Thermodesulfobacteriota bacterium]